MDEQIEDMAQPPLHKDDQNEQSESKDVTPPPASAPEPEPKDTKPSKDPAPYNDIFVTGDITDNDDPFNWNDTLPQPPNTPDISSRKKN